jgi:hypothetical protein
MVTEVSAVLSGETFENLLTEPAGYRLANKPEVLPAALE